MVCGSWYSAHGIKVERVLTDNGACYKSQKFRDACREFGISINGPTLPASNQWQGGTLYQDGLKEWAYAHTYTHLREKEQRTCRSGRIATTLCVRIRLLAEKPPASRLNGG